MIRSTNAAVLELLRPAGPQYSASSRKSRRILRSRPVMMLSSTLMPLKSATFWKVRAMPERGHVVRPQSRAVAAREEDAALAAAGRSR